MPGTPTVGPSIARQAEDFACAAHTGQLRKYTGDPYTIHLEEVARLTAQAPTVLSLIEQGYDAVFESIIAVAWLHDTVEDTDTTIDGIQRLFGAFIAGGVHYLTDPPSPDNRAKRKQDQRARLANAPRWAQTVKCADIISNTRSILEHDPRFAKVYATECHQLLKVMVDADPTLRFRALSGLIPALSGSSLPSRAQTRRTPMTPPDHAGAFVRTVARCASPRLKGDDFPSSYRMARQLLLNTIDERIAAALAEREDNKHHLPDVDGAGDH